MVAYYEKNLEDDNGKISKIVTIGNVIIMDNEQVAKGDYGEYITHDDILNLKGSVVLIKDRDMIKGDHLIYNLKSKNAKVFSDNKSLEKKRVTAILNPKKKNE